jgi:adenylate kinase
LGQRVKKILDSGALVDDRTMEALVRERLNEPDAAWGVVLDGFPRSLAQAEALDEMLGSRPRLAIVLTVPTDALERRLQARRICLKCRAIYAGGTAYGSEEELCSRCGVPLIRRDDDNSETIRRRLSIYQARVEPLFEYYRNRSALVTVDGTQAPDVVFRAMVRHVDAARAAPMAP